MNILKIPRRNMTLKALLAFLEGKDWAKAVVVQRNTQEL